MSHEPWFLGVDLGGTGSRAVALAADGAVLGRHSRTTPTTPTLDGALRFFEELVAAVSPVGAPAGVGIGASGPIDAGGVIRNPDTLPAFTDLPLVARLTQTLGVRVLIDNDAVTAAIAEHHSGAAKQAESLLHVTLGTGIGVCFLRDGVPFRGGDGTHPEAGHVAVGMATLACYCGRRRCWEQSASRGALQRAAADLLRMAAADGGAIAAADDAAGRGDVAARAMFGDYGRRVAEGLGSLLEVFRPDLVVLGGSATRAWDRFGGELDTALDPIRSHLPPFRITTTQLDDFGGAIGAALLAARPFGDRTAT